MCTKTVESTNFAQSCTKTVEGNQFGTNVQKCRIAIRCNSMHFDATRCNSNFDLKTHLLGAKTTMFSMLFAPRNMDFGQKHQNPCFYKNLVPRLPKRLFLQEFGATAAATLALEEFGATAASTLVFARIWSHGFRTLQYCQNCPENMQRAFLRPRGRGTTIAESVRPPAPALALPCEYKYK